MIARPFYNYDGACKHIVAVLKAVQHYWGLKTRDQPPVAIPKPAQINKTLPFTTSTRELLDFFQATPSVANKPKAQETVKLIPTYLFEVSSGEKKSHSLTFTIGLERMYVVRDIPQMLMAIDGGQDIIYGKSFTLKPRRMDFDDTGSALIAILQQAYQEENQRSEWSHAGYAVPVGSAFAQNRCFKLTNTNLLRFFSDYGESDF